MANALDAVLGLIAQEKQQEQFRSQQITAAAEIFQRARQATQQNQIQKLQLAQTGKYQDATLANQVIDNARQDKQLDLQKKQFGQNQLKILSENRQTSLTNKLKQQEIDLKNKEQEHQLLLEQAAMTGDYSKLLPQQELIPQQQDNNISQRPDILGLLKQPFAGQNSNAPIKQDNITQNNKFESVQSPSGKWYLKKKEGLDTSGDLSPMDQIKAINLARKVGGTRKIDAFLPIINAELKKGTPIDKIEDNMRLAGQSAKFTGVSRDATQLVVGRLPADRREYALDVLDDYIERDDISGFKEALKNVTVSSMPVEQQNKVIGRETTLDMLSSIEKDLAELEADGVNTNFFTGNYEKISNKIGLTTNPKLKAVATKILATMQNYRQFVSGAAFTDKETKEYVRLFPDIDKIGELNSANIKALKEAYNTQLDTIYSVSMGKKNYKELYGSAEIKNTSDFTYSDAKKEAEYQAWKAGQK